MQVGSEVVIVSGPFAGQRARIQSIQPLGRVIVVTSPPERVIELDRDMLKPALDRKTPFERGSDPRSERA